RRRPGPRDRSLVADTHPTPPPSQEDLRQSLEKEKTQSQKQLKDHQGEITRLNEQLQQAVEELKRLRKASSGARINSGSSSCSSCSSLMFAAVVVLGLNDLLT
uniref:Uncharacterized protein n=1 Tax=Catagonus wagneri TaxID=51154 RepID=A0A8C3WN27_9CETA